VSENSLLKDGMHSNKDGMHSNKAIGEIVYRQ